MSADRFLRTVLPSGLVLLSEHMPDRRSLALGVWVRSGARDEPAELSGISHFIEHMMFKGTERRDARAIAASLEALGGHLDAFTAREEVCYYARALAEHLPEVVDVLADIVCRSRFAPAEVDREKSVVREEIASVEDNPEDRIGELMAGEVWSGHPLGRPILGTLDSVDALDSDRLRAYHGSRYRPEHLVIAAAGAVEHERLAETIAAQFAPPDGPPLPLSGPPAGFVPHVRHETRDDLHQLYLSLGARGPGYDDPDRYALIVLNTLLGGGMSSRLFQSVREEAGLAYSVFSATDFYRETGLVSIHLGVAPDRGREALRQGARGARGPGRRRAGGGRGRLRPPPDQGRHRHGAGERLDPHGLPGARGDVPRRLRRAGRGAPADPRRDPRRRRGDGAAPAAPRPLHPLRAGPGDRPAAGRARLAGGAGLAP